MTEIDYSKAAKKLALRQRLYYGIIVAIAASVFFFIYMYSKNAQEVEQTMTELKLKDSLISKKIEDTINSINRKIKEPIKSKGTFMGKTKEGETMYKFTIQVADPNLISRLKSVDYFFNHPSYKPKHKSVNDSSFKITYDATGCLSSVDIFLHYKDMLKVDTIIYPMCSKVVMELNPQINISTPETGNFYVIAGYYALKSSAIDGYLEALDTKHYQAKILKTKSSKGYYLSVYNSTNYNLSEQTKTKFAAQYKDCWIAIAKNGNLKDSSVTNSKKSPAIKADKSVTVEVFYLEDMLTEAKPKAEEVAKLLRDITPIKFEVKLRLLPRSENAKNGYKIDANEIRYELMEAAIAAEILEIIKEKKVFEIQQPRLHQISLPTPNYISVYVRNK